MIIGKGMMAKAFVNYHNDSKVVIFASGVSNSQETSSSEYLREEKLLLKNIKKFNDKLFVYFSTVSVYDSSMANSEYVQHKMHMEAIVRRQHPNYYIFRLSQVVGETKSPTLVNTFVDKIYSQELFDVWKFSTRNLIDCEDVYKICSKIITSKFNPCSTINIASPVSFGILAIVHMIENFLGKKAVYREVDCGYEYKVDISTIKLILNKNDKIFNEKYTQFVLQKYILKDSL